MLNNLYTAEQVRKLDRTAIEQSGIPGMTLMERAGLAAFEALKGRWPETRRIAVLCGVGNNGGDGFVIARLAAADGIRVVIYQAGDPARINGDALTARERLEGSGVEIHPFDEGHTLALFDVIVDCLLGTGLTGSVRAEWRTAIEAVNLARGTLVDLPGDADDQLSVNQPAPGITTVLAVDIPSGLLADTGAIAGAAIKADITVTFIGMKQGLVTAEGAECCGDIIFNDLEVPDDVFAQTTPASQRLALADLQYLLPPRSRNSHKGQFGHVLVVGGNQGMSGAARMAAHAAARSGAGMVSVATRASHAVSISSACPELMCHAAEDRDSLSVLLQKASAIAIGPGLGQDDWSRSLLDAVLETRLLLVLDADALNLLAQEPAKSQRWILTPHPGEAAGLLGCTTTEVQGDRFMAAKKIQEKYGGVCVLKGAGTVVAGSFVTGTLVTGKVFDQVDSTGPIGLSVCSHGNPGMATAGMGDMLTGVIAALLAQGLSLIDAAKLGVCLHAAAGDRAACQGERGLMATDLLVHLRELVNP